MIWLVLIEDRKIWTLGPAQYINISVPVYSDVVAGVMAFPPQVGGIDETGGTAQSRIQPRDKDVIHIKPLPLIGLALIPGWKIPTLGNSHHIDIAFAVYSDILADVMVFPPR